MPTAVQIPRQSIPAYQHVTPAVPEMQALGVQSPIIINDRLTINDRLRPDRYIVKTIGGLRLGDVRDNRQQRTADHGEIPYDAFWGGKTVTFEGTMEAGNMPELGRLERDLVASLTTLVEVPFKFNWWDQHDGFWDTQSSAFWTALTGSSLSIPGNGRAMPSAGAATLSYHNLRGGFVDELVTAQISITPRGVAGNIGVVAGCASDTSYLRAIIVYDGSSTFTLQLQAVTAAGITNLASASLPGLNPSQYWWIRLSTISDTITASVYTADPHFSPMTTPIATCTATLMGSMAQQLGYAVPGFCGLTTSGQAAWAFMDWRAEGVWPSDFVINARPIQVPSFSHAQQKDTNRFKREFQFAVRASNPRIFSAATVSGSVGISTASSVALGRMYPRTYPLKYIIPLSEPSGAFLAQSVQSSLETNIINRGDWTAQPVIVIPGGITNPVLANLTSGDTLILDGTIAQNDYIVIDCAQHTITNSSGSSVFSMFDTAGSWIDLVPGDNIFQFTGAQQIGTPVATFYYKYAWS